MSVGKFADLILIIATLGMILANGRLMLLAIDSLCDKRKAEYLTRFALKRVAQVQRRTRNEFCLARLGKVEQDLQAFLNTLAGTQPSGAEPLSLKPGGATKRWLDQVESRLFPKAFFSLAFEVTILEALRDHLLLRGRDMGWSEETSPAAG